MTTVIDVEVSAVDTFLGSTFEAVPEAACELEQVIATEGYGLWLSGPSQEIVEEALAADLSIEAHTLVSSHPQQWLFRVEPAPGTMDVVEHAIAAGGSVLTATAEEGRWRLQVRFQERDDCRRYYEALETAGTDTTVVKMTGLDETSPASYGLTPKQYEALLAALDHGYFTIPRETSMEELATELGVSHQALSERLRRAYRALITAELDGTMLPREPATSDQAV